MTQLTHSFLDQAADICPDSLAATLLEQSLTFAQAQDWAHGYALALAEIGLRKGDRIVVQAEFSLAQLGLFFGAQILGAVFAPVHPDFSAAELERAARYLRPALVVQDAKRAVQAPLPDDFKTILLDGALAAMAESHLGRRQAEVAIDPEAAHAIFLTSGSTGQPKGVVLSHRASWLRSVMGASRAVAAGGRGELLTFPMFHWAGWNYLLENWAHRRAAHFLLSSKGEDIIRAVARHDPAYLYAIPAVWERILTCGLPFDGSRLRHVASGTSGFDVSLMERIRAACPNARQGIYYGSTEFGGTCCQLDEEIHKRVGSVGQPYAGVACKLVEGELYLKGPTLFSGYFDLPEKTAEVMQDGYYATGDLASIDDDGFITITGRAREVIRTGGESVAPVEVELALRDYPGLRGAAVIGLPDQTWGEVVCLVAEVEPSRAPPEIDDLRLWLQGRVANYKHPRRLFILDQLPRTPATGQIMRGKIKEIIQAHLA